MFSLRRRSLQDNPEYGFLFDGEGAPYYRYTLFAALAAAATNVQPQQQALQQPQAPQQPQQYQPPADPVAQQQAYQQQQQGHYQQQQWPSQKQVISPSHLQPAALLPASGDALLDELRPSMELLIRWMRSNVQFFRADRLSFNTCRSTRHLLRRRPVCHRRSLRVLRRSSAASAAPRWVLAVRRMSDLRAPMHLCHRQLPHAGHQDMSQGEA